MKRYFALLVVAMLAVFCSQVYAGQNTKLDSKQGQEQDQILVFNPQSNNNKTVGAMPETNTHGIGTAVFPMNQYGHHVDQFPVNKAIVVIRSVTRSEYNTFERIAVETNGEKVFKKIKKRVIPRPVILRTFPATDQVRFVPDLPGETSVKILGLFTYDSEKDKKYPVLPQELLMFCALDAMELGANIVIPMDQHFRAHFLPEGMEFSVGGLLTKVFSMSDPAGGAIAPHGGFAKQQNTMRGEAGIPFALLRVENPEMIFAPKPPPPVPPTEKLIDELGQGLIDCAITGDGNGKKHYDAGARHLGRYKEGDLLALSDAQVQFEQALRNFSSTGNFVNANNTRRVLLAIWVERLQKKDPAIDSGPFLKQIKKYMLALGLKETDTLPEIKYLKF